CLELLNQGATPIPPNRDRLLSEERLLKMLGALPQLDTTERGEQLSLFTQTPAPRLPQLEPRLTQVLDAIQGEATPFDFIVETTQLPPGEVSSVLLELELLEIISQLPGMRYQRC
ncbi:MAG: DNA-processing protein DprA, partial [Microcoleaceae cyanobacterium]